MEYPKEIATAVNKLFLLASMQENIIMQMDRTGLRHDVKQRFNRMYTDIKKLNRLVNNTLSAEEIEGFDLITDGINQFFESLE
jgi:hypothetical protein